MHSAGYVLEGVGEELFERGRNLVESFTGSERVALIYHPDADGLAAEYHIVKLLGDKVGMVAAPKNDGIGLTRDIYEDLMEFKPDVLVSVDMPLIGESSLDNLTELINQFGTQVLVFDHHKTRGIDLNEVEGIVYVSSDFLDTGLKDSKDYTASAIVHDFVVYCGGETRDWLTAVGIFGDWAERSHRDFLSRINKNYGEEVLKPLSRRLSLVGRAHNDFPDICLKAISASENPEILFAGGGDAREFLEKAVLLEGLVEEHIKDFEGRKIVLPGDAYLCRMKSGGEYNVKSRVIGELCERKRGNLLVLIADGKNGDCKVSFRSNGTGVNVNEMAFEVSKALGGSSGGHVQAAGAYFPSDKYDEFLKQCALYLSESK